MGGVGNGTGGRGDGDAGGCSGDGVGTGADGCLKGTGSVFAIFRRRVPEVHYDRGLQMILPDPTINPSLPPPEPMDPKGTRPPLNLVQVWLQVILIQMDVEKRAREKEANNVPHA